MSKVSLLFTDLLDQAKELDVQVRWEGNIPVIEVKGDVDKYTCQKLRKTIHQLLKDGERQIVIGMDNVEYIDSTGLGSLVGGYMSVSKENGELAITGANARVRKALNVTGLSSLIPCWDEESIVSRQSAVSLEEELPLAA